MKGIRQAHVEEEEKKKRNVRNSQHMSNGNQLVTHDIIPQYLLSLFCAIH
jgi:hypothetical protein